MKYCVTNIDRHSNILIQNLEISENVEECQNLLCWKHWKCWKMSEYSGKCQKMSETSENAKKISENVEVCVRVWGLLKMFLW